MFGSKINPPGAAADVGDAIANSILFDRADDPGITRTHSTTADSDKKVTISWWQKFTAEGNADSGLYVCFSASKSVGNSAMDFYFNAGYAEWYFLNSGTIDGIVRTNREFRDHTGWTNFVLSIDTTISSPASARMRMWINGIEETSLTSSSGSPQYPAQNDLVNVLADGTKLVIGEDDGGGYNFDGYLADFIMLDGIAVTDATNFGRFSESHSSVWVPVNYSGSYGTNGFRLDFAVAPGTGNGAGTDASGNGRHFTDSNLVASDQVGDTPTNNYPIMSGLCPDFSDGGTWSKANMKIVSTSEDSDVIWTAPAISSGKHFFQWDFTNNASSGNMRVGMSNLENFDGHTFNYSSSDHLVLEADHRNDTWQKYDGSYSTENAGNPNATGRYCMAVDFDAGKCWFGLIDTSDGSITWYDNSNGSSGNPASGANPVFTFTANTPLVGHVLAGKAAGTSWTVDLDFGQFGFGNTVLPTGYTGYGQSDWEVLSDIGGIEKPGDFFKTTTYTGDGVAAASGGKGITGVGFQPSWTWIKDRDNTNSHRLFDAVRGNGKRLFSDRTDAESSTTEEHLSFDSDGFTVGSDSSVNGSSTNYVSWNWKADTTFTNDASATSIGTLDSSGRVNASDSLSIISYTGNGTSGASIKHGLSAAPELVIHKERDNANGWLVGATDVGYTKMLRLDTTDAATSDSAAWNDTAPSSSIITLGNGNGTNRSGGAMICYAMRSVSGVCKVGVYEGNNSSDGVYINLGFQPRWFMVKNVDTAGQDWRIYDSILDATNPNIEFFKANTNAAQISSSGFDFLANGVKARDSNAGFNASATYLYVAFAEAAIGGGIPYPNAR